MTRIVLSLLALVVVGGLVFAGFHRNPSPSVPFAQVGTERLVSNLTTNGKVEPVQYAIVRSDREGAIARIAVQRGDAVAKDQVLVQFNTLEAENDLANARLRIAEAQAQKQQLASGGRSSELVEIQNSLLRAEAELQIARSTAASAKRLQTKGAITRQEVLESDFAAEKLQQQLEALQRRKASLVSTTDREVAQVRIQQGELAATTAQRLIARSQVRSPIAGTVYEFDLKAGAYLNPGDRIAAIGSLDQVRVTVYVDEPELGRVSVGLPVVITWDALPGKRWTGQVDRLPSQITTLATRQVGEVSCVIDNPDRQLLPGTNVNAEIRVKVVDSAISIPREAIRHLGEQEGVYTLGAENRIHWTPVKLGVNSLTRTQVVSGLEAGAKVALPTEANLKEGLTVRPVAGK